MNLSNEKPFPPRVYVPGFSRRKLLLMLCGFAVFASGISQLWTPAELLILGRRAKAEATDVIRTKEGFPDLLLSSDLQIRANLQPADRSYIFWNEFRYYGADGRAIDVRSPVGSQLKPLYPLTDMDGLPTTELIYYNPSDPGTVVFPLLISTWFAPGVLTIIGLLAITIGAVLFYWARTPIELPQILPGGGQPARKTSTVA